MTPETGLVKGNTTSIMLNCSTEAEVRELFDALSKKGQIHHLIETTFWGVLSGNLTDQFGNNLILNFDNN